MSGACGKLHPPHVSIRHQLKWRVTWGGFLRMLKTFLSLEKFRKEEVVVKSVGKYSTSALKFLSSLANIVLMFNVPMYSIQFSRPVCVFG